MKLREAIESMNSLAGGEERFFDEIDIYSWLDVMRATGRIEESKLESIITLHLARKHRP